MLNSDAVKKLPLHVGIIMDGNRRWAKNRGLPTSSGHSRGAEVFKNLALYCNKIGLKHLTVYAFSTENWKRSSSEVSALMFLFKKYLKSVMRDFKNENIRLSFIGEISKFSNDIQKLIETIETETKDRTGMHLNIAMNYGGRSEIINAVKNLQRDFENSENKNISDLTEEKFSSYLYTENQPDVDLLIRTGGEKRISNFLLWQSAYAELYFTDVLWPDFSEKIFDEAINEYFNRNRRFGGE